MLAVLLVLLLGVPIVSAQAQFDETVQLDGVTIDKGDGWDREAMNSVESTLTQYGIDVPSNVSLYMESETRSYVLLTNESPRSAAVSGTAREILPPDSDTFGVLIGEDVRYDTEPQQVSRDDLAQNADQYVLEYVEVSGHVRGLSHTMDASDEVVEQNYLGSIRNPWIYPRFLDDLGQQSRWATTNLSGAEYGSSKSAEVAEKMEPVGSRILLSKPDGQEWWVGANGSVRGVVVPSESGGATLFVEEVTPDSTQVGSLAEARENEGEVVTVEANGVGTAISSQETLLSAAKCAPSSISNPVTGCLPIPSDAVTHTGVLFDGVPTDRSDVLVYGGISNAKQSRPAIGEEGRYRLTGRVVSASAVDRRLNGSALIVLLATTPCPLQCEHRLGDC